MLDIAKRTAFGALLLLIMPLGVWISGWQWQPGSAGFGLRVLFWMTETVTSPWGVVTSVILCGWFLWCLRFRLKPAIFLLVIMVAAILAGQYTKSFIKERVQEPRPYVVWLEKSHGVDESAFYELKRKARGKMVTQLLQDDNQLPAWLKQHWAFETGFAFPSGHTLFAASWALLGVGLLWPRRHIKTVVLLLLWASGVMGSRMLLGMHWPRDLVVATLISWLLVTLATWLAQRVCGPLTVPPQEQQEIRQREDE
ncbi:phosphatidylglycerophosphatase B [Erwiniaceae bacterium BAC15a-03b]|uniref:undecaprenyl-diphosphate phosphatase n=1 Tax=Winslowiella arboricola TaxID=2978220 RepID=A0A9J6PZM6_9GAMM|nr:phosphatidylglycerophosphatase B [Winslowiella arboricola]MCU5775694.1 phosphatidylglycerophosphatase B [Winslowiella arboricola]MCU5779455.1 phosphatidylglycerophosphatase B [Winslowiella arboricola]